MTFDFHPVTPDRFADLDALFTSSDAEGGANPARCWCMEWRLPRDDWESGQGEGNRSAMLALVERGEVPGILAYADGEAVGWCSVSPRTQVTNLRERGAFRNFESAGVWSIVCFYVRDDHRGAGLQVALLSGAVAYAKERGARRVEGYPIDPEAMTEETINMTRFMGHVDAFRKAGFVEAARAADGRPMMRYDIEGSA